MPGLSNLPVRREPKCCLSLVRPADGKVHLRGVER